MKKVNCILLVDDNPADNYYHKYIITDAAVCNRIEAVFSGDEALAYLIKSGEVGQEKDFPKEFQNKPLSIEVLQEIIERHF